MSTITTEDILLQLKENANPNDLKPILKALSERFSPEMLETQLYLAGISQGVQNPFERGECSAANLPEATMLNDLWFGIYPGKVTFFVGETGAGKSSALYNICLALAQNETIWGVAPGVNMPIACYYIDPENAGNFDDGDGGLCKIKMERLVEGELPCGFHFHDGRGVNLSMPAHMAFLKERVEQGGFGVIVVDPLIDLFGMANENDPVEAGRTMRACKHLSRETGAAVVVVHHTGKQASDWGRGSSAFLSSADVGMVYRAVSDVKEDDVDDSYNGELIPRNDICRLQIVKNRMGGKGSLYLQMTGEDRFCRVGFDAWKELKEKSGISPEIRVAQAQQEIPLLLMEGGWLSRADITESLIAQTYKAKTATIAIMELAKNGVLTQRKGRGGRAEYALTSMLEAQSAIQNAASDDPFDDAEYF